MQAGMKNSGTDPAKQAYITGLKMYRDGDLKGACGYFTTAISAGINDFDILYYRGMCYLDTGDYQSALTDFEILVRNNPTNYEYLYRRGFIHYKLGMNSEAFHDFGQIPDDFDDFSIRWHYLSVLFFKANEPEPAFAAIERALGKFPTMPKIWFNAGVILTSMKLDDRADLAFQTAIKLDSRLAAAPRRIME
jgi:tetratricopeptide (TPR) repeat protein